ncbi:MAG: OsmC family protein [Promethearchaeota archaeon]
MTIDEPEPVGKDVGPNASRVLSAAIGNCLSASLLFCLQRSKQPVGTLRTEVITRIVRNSEGRWRIGNIRVQLHVGIQGLDTNRLQRCIDIFENYCVVTASVRQGIPIDVTVIPAE